MNKTDTIGFLWELLSIETKEFIKGFLILSILVTFKFYPGQYMKYGGIFCKAIFEQIQKEKMEELKLVIDHYSRSIKK